MKLVLVTPAADEPVSLDDLKNHLRVEIADEDTDLSIKLAAAREWCEGYARRSFVTKTYDLYLDAWPDSGEIELPRAPLNSVTSIQYTDEDGNTAAWPSSNYLVSASSLPGKIVFKRNVSTPNVTLQEIDGIVVRFVAGYGNPDDVPDVFKLAIMMLVADWYENREDSVLMPGVSAAQVPNGVRALLHMKRVYGF